MQIQLTDTTIVLFRLKLAPFFFTDSELTTVGIGSQLFSVAGILLTPLIVRHILRIKHKLISFVLIGSVAVHIVSASALALAQRGWVVYVGRFYTYFVAIYEINK